MIIAMLTTIAMPTTMMIAISIPRAILTLLGANGAHAHAPGRAHACAADARAA
jgi:hypothetical protein